MPALTKQWRLKWHRPLRDRDPWWRIPLRAGSAGQRGVTSASDQLAIAAENPSLFDWLPDAHQYSTFQVVETRENVLTGHNTKLSGHRTGPKEEPPLVFLMCTPTAKPCISRNQANTLEGCALGLRIVCCFAVYLDAWRFSWGWQVTQGLSNPFRDQLILSRVPPWGGECPSGALWAHMVSLCPPSFATLTSEISLSSSFYLMCVLTSSKICQNRHHSGETCKLTSLSGWSGQQAYRA